LNLWKFIQYIQYLILTLIWTERLTWYSYFTGQKVSATKRVNLDYKWKLKSTSFELFIAEIRIFQCKCKYNLDGHNCNLKTSSHMFQHLRGYKADPTQISECCCLFFISLWLFYTLRVDSQNKSTCIGNPITLFLTTNWW